MSMNVPDLGAKTSETGSFAPAADYSKCTPDIFNQTLVNAQALSRSALRMDRSNTQAKLEYIKRAKDTLQKAVNGLNEQLPVIENEFQKGAGLKDAVILGLRPGVRDNIEANQNRLFNNKMAAIQVRQQIYEEIGALQQAETDLSQPPQKPDPVKSAMMNIIEMIRQAIGSH